MGFVNSHAKVQSFGSTSSTAPRFVPFMFSINRFFVHVALKPAALCGRRIKGSPTVNGVCGSSNPLRARRDEFSQVYDPVNSSEAIGRSRIVVSSPFARDLAIFSESKFVGRLPVVTI